MSIKPIVVAGLLALALLVPPGIVGSSSAIPIPSYFQGERTGLVCAMASFRNAPSTKMLVQVNSDPSFNGGISLPQADTLFQGLVDGTGPLASLLGPGVQILCQFGPTFVQNNTTLDGQGLAQVTSGAFQSAGYATLLILDTYVYAAPAFLGGFSVLRVDIYTANGPGDLSYVESLEVPAPF